MTGWPEPAAGAAVALAFAAVCSWLGVAAARRWALAKSILDSPNERSSHVAPTPRGGGIGIVAGLAIALSAGAAFGAAPAWALEAFLLSLPIAWIGWEDDKRGLSARARLAAQLLLATVWIAYVSWKLAPFPAFAFAPGAAIGGPIAWAFAILFVAWMTNLHNFMDGIDGLAAAQAISVGLGGALIAGLDPAAGSSLGSSGLGGWTAAQSPGSIGFVWAALAAASAGFLAWNWSPAKIFMGDVGSAFVGFLIACLAIRWEAERPGALALVAILDAAFIVDATWTLAARALRRRKLSQAHRSHAYQIAARRLESHAKAASIVLVYNVTALIPLAAAAASGWIAPWAAFALGALPAAGACLCLKAGRD